MKKTLTLFLVAVVFLGAGASAQAALKFNIDEGFNLFNDSRLEGQTRHVGIMFDMSDELELGFFIENADLQLSGDVGATPPNTTQLNFNAQGIRLMKKFTKWMDAGVDVGSARIQQGPTSGAFAPTAALSQNKPFVGLLGVARAGTDISEKFTADMHLTIGYRFLDLNDTSLAGAPAGESTLDDLSTLMLGLGVGFRF